MLFESLGRVLHLLEDMSVPAHVRNDMKGHLDYTKISEGTFKKFFLPVLFLNDDKYEGWGDVLLDVPGAGNLYEFWVEQKIDLEQKEGRNYVSALCGSEVVPVEFGRPQDYWDQEIYHIDDTTFDQNIMQGGLAEYTSANYLSEHAKFTNHFDNEDKKFFPFPREECTGMELERTKFITAEDGTPDEVRFLPKVQDGELFEDEPFAKYSYAWKAVDERGNRIDPETRKVVGSLCYKLDEQVHEAYAKRLIPKTVGYAAGLINHFFRGKLEAAITGTPIIDPVKMGIKELTIAARNITPDESTMDGSLYLVVKYRMNAEESFKYIKSQCWDKFSIPADSSEEFFFDFSGKEIPINAEEISLNLVYRPICSVLKSVVRSEERIRPVFAYSLIVPVTFSTYSFSNIFDLL